MLGYLFANLRGLKIWVRVPFKYFLQHARFENWIFLSWEHSSSDALRPIGRKRKHLIGYNLGYMPSDFMCFEKRTVSRHWVSSSKTLIFEEQMILSKDKYPRIFQKPNAIAFLQTVFETRAVLKAGEYSVIWRVETNQVGAKILWGMIKVVGKRVTAAKIGVSGSKTLLNKCALRWRLKVLMLELERISCGRAFYNFGAATWND